MTGSSPVAARPAAAAAAGLPSAHHLADVLHVRGQRHVRLPPRFAVAAALKLIEIHRAEGSVVEGPADPAQLGWALRADEWAVCVRIGVGVPLKLMGTARRRGDDFVWVFPKHTLIVPTQAEVKLVRRALEAVKPDELDAAGRPFAWVEAPQRVESLLAAAAEDDAIELGAHEVLPPAAGDAPDDGAFIATAEIRERFAALAAAIGVAAPELTIARGREARHGLVTGRVWSRGDHVPVRVHITTCPNADWAEVLATLVHELAHPLSRTRAHGDAFKRTFVALAEHAYGARWFAGARARLGDAYGVLDLWVASGIRAALRGGEPPQAKEGDDGQLARVLTKIRKLRELAHNQVGRPEGIAATATANDLITAYGLDSYSVRIDEALDEQMVDRFVVLEDGAVWRRMLAHAVASYCEVFSLAVSGKHRMHWFGRRADVIAAEYIYSVSAARIERECAAHLVVWKRRQGRTTAADTVRERTSFCDCAVLEFRKKLVTLESEDTSATEGRALAAAEALARVEHEKRGITWGSGGGKRYRENAAGRAAGRAMEVVRGVDGPGGSAPLGLPRRA